MLKKSLTAWPNVSCAVVKTSAVALGESAALDWIAEQPDARRPHATPVAMTAAHTTVVWNRAKPPDREKLTRRYFLIGGPMLRRKSTTSQICWSLNLPLKPFMTDCGPAPF
jgi:hypothetical protein